MKRGYLKSFVADAFEVDFKSVCAEIDEKFHISYDRPVDNASSLEPQQHLKSVRALAKA